MEKSKYAIELFSRHRIKYSKILFFKDIECLYLLLVVILSLFVFR